MLVSTLISLFGMQYAFIEYKDDMFIFATLEASLSMCGMALCLGLSNNQNK